MALLVMGLHAGSVSGVAATLFDWEDSAVAWPFGSLTGSFDIDATNPGNDITITISGDTSRYNFLFRSESTLNTGGTGESNLQLLVNYANTSEELTVTIEFHYVGGVQDVSFDIFDVDNGTGFLNFTDEIRDIRGRMGAGSDVYATVTGSANNSVSGSGTAAAKAWGTADSPGNSADGNVTIDFGGQIIDEISFVYGSGPGAPSNPSLQSIGLHDISFTVVPEANLAWVAAAGAWMGWRMRRRKHP